MSKAKIDHIALAYKRLRISGITVNPSNEDIRDALEVLEDMMHELRSRNICSSYIFEDQPDPNSDSGIDPQYNNATSTNLAIRLAAFFNKAIPRELQAQANASMSNWSARSGKINPIQPPRRQPIGSGSTFRFPRWLRYYRIENGAPISCDTFNLKVGEVDFFSVDFSNYLLDGAVITSISTEPSDGIKINAELFTDSAVNLECTGVKSGSETIKITITTSSGRTNPETINFNVTES